MWTGINALAEALEKHQATLYKEQITNLVMVGDSQDTAALVDQVLGIMYGQTEALFQQMKIKVDMELIRVDVLAELVEALLFEPNDQDGEILAALMASEDSVGAFCDAIGIRTTTPPEAWLEVINDVSDFTIAVMIEVVTRSVDRQKYSEQDVEICLGKLNKHQTLVPAGSTLAMEALSTGVPIGASMGVMFDHYKEKFETGTIVENVDSLLSLAILAKTEPDCVKDEVEFFLEQLYPDIHSMQQATKQLHARMGTLEEDF